MDHACGFLWHDFCQSASPRSSNGSVYKQNEGKNDCTISSKKSRDTVFHTFRRKKTIQCRLWKKDEVKIMDFFLSPSKFELEMSHLKFILTVKIKIKLSGHNYRTVLYSKLKSVPIYLSGEINPILRKTQFNATVGNLSNDVKQEIPAL